jgi:hypothetical protein
MKKLLCVGSILFIGLTCFAQKLPLHLNNDTTKYKYPPTIVIHAKNQIIKNLSYKSLSLIDPGDIIALKILKDTEATALYGVDGRYGVMDIYFKDSLNLDPSGNSNYYDFNNIIATYNIGKYKGLPVYVDSVLVLHPEKIFIPPLNIKSAKIDKEAESGIEFINIITGDIKRKPGIIYIRGSVSG